MEKIFEKGQCWFTEKNIWKPKTVGSKRYIISKNTVGVKLGDLPDSLKGSELRYVKRAFWNFEDNTLTIKDEKTLEIKQIYKLIK